MLVEIHIPYISARSSEAQSRVEEMEKERKKLDKQLDHALEKAKAANHGQEVLETKIKVSILACLFNSVM